MALPLPLPQSATDTIHFLLSSETSSVTCSLSSDRDVKKGSALPLSNVKENRRNVSFNVSWEDANEKEIAQWLKDNLEDCTVRVIDGEVDNGSVDPPEDTSSMVKDLANLWVESQMNGERQVKARAPYASSSTSSFPAHRPRFGEGPLRNSIISTSTSITTLNDDGRARFFYVDLHNSRPSTADTTPAATIDEKRSFFEEPPLREILPDRRSPESNEEQQKDLIMPVRPLEIYVPPGRAPSPDPETPASSRPQSPTVADPDAPAAVVSPIATPADVVHKSSRSPWQFLLRKKTAAIDKPALVTTPSEKPAIILPSPPRDDEKYLYAQTRRAPLYIFGTFSFLSVSVGMWFFAISSSQFYWFGVFVGLIQIYLVISYIVGYCGKDFSVDEHKKLLEEHSYGAESSPLVDIYLPCCKEPLEVLENTYKYVSQLNYPNYKVHVLDDGGLDSVKRLAKQYKFNYITRDNKPHLKKAGNLRYAFARTEGEFFVIYDADFCPRPDFLDETLPYMKKFEDIAIVQSPQFFRPSGEQTWVEQGASATQELFYRIVQVNRDRWNAAICVGSNAVYRRAALVEVGGTAEIGHSEDVHTGFYAATRGWRLKYIPLALACGVSPDTPQAFFSQQMRWCAGSTTLLTNPDFWKSKLSIIQKICFLSGMMYYTAAAMMIFLVPLPGLLMIWLNPSLVMWFNFAYAFPSLIYSVIIFRLWSRQMYNFNVNFVFVIQQYAYLMAVKDRILGTTASWVPSGDNQSHVKGEKKKKAGGNNKYRNMRILCCVWVWGTTGGMVAGVTLRMVQGYHWYNFLPLILLDAFTVFISHKFIFYS